MMPQSLFELKDVVKEYDGVPVLQIKDLQMEERKIYAIMGPNGSGKSTLLKLLNLLEKPTRGRVTFQAIKQKRKGTNSALPSSTYYYLNPCVSLRIVITGVTLTVNSVQATSRHTEGFT